SLGSLAMAHPRFGRMRFPSRKGGANDYESNAGERSAPGFSSAGSKRVKGFTLPRAAVTDSATPGWRARSVARNARISPRTLGLSEHAQPTVVRPRARV